MYLPDLPRRPYQDLLDTFERELTHTFGGCSVLRGVDGYYLSDAGEIVGDRINLLYTDACISFDDKLDIITRYLAWIEESAIQALDEECILVVVYKVHHFRSKHRD